MSSPGTYPAARIVLIWVVALAILLLPQVHASAHVAMERAADARHASLSVSATDVEHSHDDGDDHERRLGHSHSQDALDHSHDTSLRSDSNLPFACLMAAAWRPANGLSLCRGVVFGHERPPRSFVG